MTGHYDRESWGAFTKAPPEKESNADLDPEVEAGRLSSALPGPRKVREMVARCSPALKAVKQRSSFDRGLRLRLMPPATTRLSVIIPTLDEAGNLPRLVRLVDRALLRISHEIIVVDGGSTDGTGGLADAYAATRQDFCAIHCDPAERGLSLAILSGFEAARGEVVAVLDADLQHDPRVLPRLLTAAETHDLAIGSRYTYRGKTCGWSWLRKIQSRGAAYVTRASLGLRVRDPLSGCFAIRREALQGVKEKLRPRGWKLLLDILALAPSLTWTEVPMTFRSRWRGKTKMSGAVVRAWLRQLRELRRMRRALASLPSGAAT